MATKYILAKVSVGENPTLREDYEVLVRSFGLGTSISRSGTIAKLVLDGLERDDASKTFWDLHKAGAIVEVKPLRRGHRRR